MDSGPPNNKSRAVIVLKNEVLTIKLFLTVDTHTHKHTYGAAKQRKKEKKKRKGVCLIIYKPMGKLC